MIPFKMTVKNRNTDGSFGVEYVPENSDCTPVTLNLTVDGNLNKDELLNRFKLSSPQDFWIKEIQNSRAGNSDIDSLINTTHTVTELASEGYEGNSSPEVFHAPPSVPFNSITLPVSSPSPSTPEQTATFEERNMIKLKVLIQQVIQEMAESTV